MASIANLLGGGAAGASAGAAIGSLIPGVGTAIGAGLGGLVGGFGGGLEDLFGSKGGPEQRNILRPNQSALQDNLINHIQSLLSGQGGLSPISQNAQRRFNTQTVPGLAERFSSLGSGGSQNSSAFQGALGAAGSGLQQELAGLDMNLILQLLGPALGQSSENLEINEGPGFGQQAGYASLQSLPLLLKLLGGNQQF